MARAFTTPAIPVSLRASGFSLVEMMVAITLGLLVLVAMLQAYVDNSASASTNTRSVVMQTNGRYAIDFLRRELHHAGFLGIQRIDSIGLGETSIVKSGSTGAITSDGCGTAGFLTLIEQPIWGGNDAKSVSCTGMNYAAGDVLVVRGVDYSSGSPAAVLQCQGTPAYGANTLYVMTEYNVANVYLGSAAPGVTVRPGETYTPECYPLKVAVYYISPCSNPPGSTCESPAVPALYRLKLGTDSTAAMTAEMIATGIDDLQVQYGIPAAAGGLTYVNADAVASADWPNVSAVKIWILARSTDAEYGGFVNTKTYTMGDHTYYPGGKSGSQAAGDNFVRQVFTTVVQLRN